MSFDQDVDLVDKGFDFVGRSGNDEPPPPPSWIPAGATAKHLLKVLSVDKKLDLFSNKADNFKSAGLKVGFGGNFWSYSKQDIKPVITPNLVVSGGQVQKLSIKNTLINYSLSGIAFQGTVKISNSFEQELFKKTWPAVFKATIGPVPFWLDAELKAKLAFTPAIEFIADQVMLGLETTTTGEGEIDYVKGRTPAWDFKTGYSFNAKPQTSGKLDLGNPVGSLKVGVGPELAFNLYSVAGPKFSLVGYVKFSHKLTGTITSPDPNVSFGSVKRSQQLNLYSDGVVNPAITMQSGLEGVIALGTVGSKTSSGTDEIADAGVDDDGNTIIDDGGGQDEDDGGSKPKSVQVSLPKFSRGFNLPGFLQNLSITLDKRDILGPFDLGSLKVPLVKFSKENYWVGFFSDRVGALADAELGKSIKLDACSFKKDDEGNHKIRIEMYSKLDPKGKKPLATANSVPLKIQPPDIGACSGFNLFMSVKPNTVVGPSTQNSSSDPCIQFFPSVSTFEDNASEIDISLTVEEEGEVIPEDSPRWNDDIVVKVIPLNPYTQVAKTSSPLRWVGKLTKDLETFNARVEVYPKKKPQDIKKKEIILKDVCDNQAYDDTTKKCIVPTPPPSCTPPKNNICCPGLLLYDPQDGAPLPPGTDPDPNKAYQCVQPEFWGYPANYPYCPGDNPSCRPDQTPPFCGEAIMHLFKTIVGNEPEICPCIVICHCGGL